MIEPVKRLCPKEPVVKVGATEFAPDGSFVQFYREARSGILWKCTTTVDLRTVWEETGEIIQARN